MKTKEMTLSGLLLATFIILIIFLKSQLWLAQIAAAVSFFMLAKQVKLKSYFTSIIAAIILLTMFDLAFIPWMVPILVVPIFWTRVNIELYTKIVLTIFISMPLYWLTYMLLQVITSSDAFSVIDGLLYFAIIGESIMIGVTMYFAEGLYERLNK